MIINSKHFPIKGEKLNYAGCSCHNSKQSRRTVKKSAKQREKRSWQRDQNNF